MKKIMFSILIPVYNTENYLDQCIKSVLNQTFSDWELIIVDDGSTDSSGEIADRYAKADDRIRVYHTENAGPLSARPYAIRRAAGEYCLSLDSDDWLELHALDTIAEQIVRINPDCVIYGLKRVDDGGKTIEVFTDKNNLTITDRERNITQLVCDCSYNSMCRKAVRREILAATLTERKSSLRQAEDLRQSIDVYLRLGTVVYLSAVLYDYRLNMASMSNTIDIVSQQRDIFGVRSYVLMKLKKNCDLSEKSWRRIRSYYAVIFSDMIRNLAAAMSLRTFRKKMEKYSTSEYARFIFSGERSTDSFYLRQYKSGSYRLIWTVVRVKTAPKRLAKAALKVLKRLRTR